MSQGEEERLLKARKRVVGFGLHLLGYFVVMAILVPLNLFVYPQSLWFVFPLVGWGSVLAIHAAYAMGLFGGFTSDG